MESALCWQRKLAPWFLFQAASSWLPIHWRLTEVQSSCGSSYMNIYIYIYIYISLYHIIDRYICDWYYNTYIYIYNYIVAATRVSLFHPQTKTNYEDECCRRIPERRIAPRRRITPPEDELPPRRRIPRRQIAPPKTNSFPKTNSRKTNCSPNILPSQRRIPRRRLACPQKTNSRKTNCSFPKTRPDKGV